MANPSFFLCFPLKLFTCREPGQYKRNKGYVGETEKATEKFWKHTNGINTVNSTCWRQRVEGGISHRTPLQCAKARRCTRRARTPRHRMCMTRAHTGSRTLWTTVTNLGPANPQHEIKKQGVHIGYTRNGVFLTQPWSYLLHCLLEVTTSWGAQRLTWTSTSDVSADRWKVWYKLRQG